MKKVSLSKILSLLFLSVFISLSVSCNNNIDDEPKAAPAIEIKLPSETTSATIGEIAEISVSFSNFSVEPETVDIFVEEVDTPIKEAASVKDGKISIDTTGFEARTYKLYVKSGTVKSNSLSVVLVKSSEEKVSLITISSETTSATIGEIAEISVSFSNFSVAPETVDIFVEEVDTPIKESASVKDGKISIDTTGFEAGTYKLYVKSGTVKSNSLSVVLVENNLLPVPEGVTVSASTTKNKVTVKWTDNGSAKYWIYYNTENNTATAICETKFADSYECTYGYNISLPSSGIYYFWVKSADGYDTDSNTSDFSEVVTYIN